MFTGYYKNPEENAKVFDEDGFFKTGDVATIGERATSPSPAASRR